MKSGRTGRDRTGNRARRAYRIIALIICIALAVTAVAVGVSISTSIAHAEPADSSTTETGGTGDTADGTDVTGGTDAGEATGGTDSGSDAGEGEPAATKKPVSISFIRYPVTMSVGSKSTITYDLENAEAGAVVKWQSSDEEVATVDSDGTVRAIAEGDAKITASLDKAKKSITVSVTEDVIEPEAFMVEVDEFAADDLLLVKHSIAIGDKLHMRARVEPAGAKLEGKFEWNIERTDLGVSSGAAVSEEAGGDPVRIDVEGENGESAVLTAIGDGEATVTVRYVDDETKDRPVKLNDYTLVFVASEKPAALNLFPIVALIAATILIIIVLIIIVNSRRRRRDYGRPRKPSPKRRRRAAKPARSRKPAPRRRRKPAHGGRQPRDSYGRGYRDAEPEQFERTTRVYDAPPATQRELPPEGYSADCGYVPNGRQAPQRPSSSGNYSKNGNKEEPFSLDDIE
jgi:hypothetical protein